MNARRFLHSLAALVLAATFAGATPTDETPKDGESSKEKAQEHVKELANLSLADLLEIDVSVASIRHENIIDTPAIVSRYNADDMAGMGLRTLKDMLSFIPGVVVQDSGAGLTTVMVRGVHDLLNQKLLFLLDDVPYWMSAHSSIPLLGIPFEAIDHVEVIRGPGAVFYGSNASAGVIKVVTRKQDNNRLAIAGGSNSLVDAGGFLNHSFSQDTEMSASFQVRDENGYPGVYEQRGETPGTLAINRFETVNSVLAQFRHKTLSVMVQTYKSEKNGVQLVAPIQQPNQQDFKGTMFHADYEWDWQDTDLAVYSDYNKFYMDWHHDNFGFGLGGDDSIIVFEDSGAKNYRWRSGARLNYEFTDSLVLTTGAELEVRSTGKETRLNKTNDEIVGGTILEAQKRDERSLYAQLDWDLEKWRFLVGGRFVSNEQSGEDFSPRGGVVYKISDYHSLKALYSEGFNSPNFIQTDISVPPFAIGNPNLVAEKNKTVDLAYTFSRDNALFVGNVYFFQFENIIQRPGANFINGDRIDGQGVELDYQHALGEWKLFANFDYRFKEGDVADRDQFSLVVPTATSSIGALYQLRKRHLIGGSLRYIGKRNHPLANRSAVDPFTRVNVNYQFNHELFQAFFTIENLLDEQIVNPDVTFFTFDEVLVPGADGIAFLVGFRARF